MTSQLNVLSKRRVQLALRISLIFLISRALCLLPCYFFDGINGQTYDSFEDRIEAYFYRWDVTWYHAISQHGYQAETAITTEGHSRLAFYPALPFLGRATSAMSGLPSWQVGMLMTTLAFFVSLFLFYRYCRLRGAGETTALTAVMLLAFCPQGFVYSLYYSESIFLLFCLSTLIAFESRRTLLAGGLAAITTLTRSNALFIGVFFIDRLIRETIIGYKKGNSWREILQANAPTIFVGMCLPFGLVAYYWYCYIQVGDAFAQSSTVSEGWGWKPGLFTDNIANWLSHGSFHEKFWTVTSLFFCAASFYLIKRRLWSDLAFCLLNFLLFYSGTLAHSLLRYSIALFPVFLAIAFLLEQRPRLTTIIIVLFSTLNTLVLYGWYQNHIIGI